MNFYPSLSFHDVDDLAAADAETLLAAAKMIEARRDLRLIEIASFPHMARNAQTEMHKRIFTEANPQVMEKPRPLTLEDLKRFGFGRRRD